MISTEREGRNKELFTSSEQNAVNIICRLCGQCRSDVIPIFSEEAHRKLVLLKIQTRLLIQISASDPLPKNACVNCLEKLDSLWDFYELCRKTQIKLREKFLKKRRDGQVALRERSIDHLGSIGTSYPPRCSLKSITHRTTQNTADSASGNKRIKLEHVPFIKEELVCSDENSCTFLASAVRSAESQESYQNNKREISAESSKNSSVSVRLDHQQESDTVVKKLCLSEMVDAIIRKNMLVLQDCGSGDGIDGRSTVSLSMKPSDHQKATPSELIDNSLGQQEKLQDVFQTKPVIDKQVLTECVNSSEVQENKSRNTPIISLSNNESDENVLLDRTDSLLCSAAAEEGRYSPVGSFVPDMGIQKGVSLIGTRNCITQEMEEDISMRSSLSCRKNQEDLQEMNGDYSVRCSSENICQAGVLSVNTGTSHVQEEKDENSLLGSLLRARGNLEKVWRAALQKEDTDIHIRKSVCQEGIKCSTLDDKDKTVSNNTVSHSDTVRNSGKLRGDGGDDDNFNDDSSDCDNIFSCHDCGSCFSCKNSLTDHIFNQHVQAGRTNILNSALPTEVTLDSLDSSMNKLSSFDVGSVHTANSLSSVESQDLKQNNNRKISDESSSNSDIVDGIHGGSTVFLNKMMSDHQKETSSDLIDDSLGQQEKLQDVFQMKPVIDKQVSLDCVNTSEVQENEIRNIPVISLSHNESDKNVLLDRTDSSLCCTAAEEGRYFPVESFVSDSEIERRGSLSGTQEVEERISLRSCIDHCVSQQQINENSSGRSSAESINPARDLSVNARANHFQLGKDKNNILRSLLCVSGNLEKEGKATLQKEATDTHERRSVSQEEIKCHTQEEKDNISASNNTVSDGDTVNNCGKLHGGGGDSDCSNRFSCHDCDAIFSCKNSLTDHIFKQHIHTEQTNTLHATSPTKVTVDCSDCSNNKLSSSSVVSVHNVINYDSVLQKRNGRSLLAEDKPTKDAQASNCDAPSVDDNDCIVICSITSNNTSHVEPLETELKPTTIEEARLMCEKYSESICETSGKNPKINMINIKVELTSGNTYTRSNVLNYRKFFKPFIVLSDSRYNCQICKKTLNNRVAIIKHIGEHFNLFPYCCANCERRFTLQSCANEHIKIHITKLICEQCGKVCNSSPGYTNHMRGHDKPFICHDCGRRFRSKILVSSHIWKVHMKIRSYACKICGKAYFHESNVSTHMIFAHAERKIVCQYCGKMYFRNNMLKEHIKRWHN